MIKRTVYNDIFQHLNAKAFTILIGARQVGKTSLVRELYRELVKKEEIYFFNIEDQEIARAINDNPKNIFRFTRTTPTPILEGKQDKRLFLLLDEIQYLKNPSYFLKFIYDTYAPNVKIIATGSSAFYIDKKFTDSLAGRKRIFNLYPFSFTEFLSATPSDDLLDELVTIKKNKYYQSLKMVELNKYFFEYLTYGGYPEVVLASSIEEKIAILDELKNAYVKKDILESGIDKEDKFYMLFEMLADQTGNLVNVNELTNTLGIDNRTVKNYLYVLQKSFHITLIKPFHQNLRKELTKMPKVYFNDLGLRNILLNRFSGPEQRLDKGALLENYFLNTIKQNSPSTKINFWRTISGNEVDFVTTKTTGEKNAFEIKWSGKKFTPNKYKKFTNAYPSIPLKGISFDGKMDTDRILRY